MAGTSNLAYSYTGKIDELFQGIKKSCEKMSLTIKDEPLGFR